MKIKDVPAAQLCFNVRRVARVAAVVGITVLNIALTRYLHDAMPSNIRAGASSVVSTIGYGVFVPTALGFGLFSRAHGIFGASAFVVAPLGVMCLSVVCARRRIRRPGPRQAASGAAQAAPPCPVPAATRSMISVAGPGEPRR